MNIGALNSGPDIHLLDHIAPLAALLEIPLLVTEETNLQLAKRFYPHVQTSLHEDLEFHLAYLAERFDCLIECKFWAAHLKNLFRNIYKKEMQLIFCPHGQSDKGYSAPLLAPYAQQDIVLLYGNLLAKMLKELKIWPAIERYAFIGDYRAMHYRQHQPFYDDLVEKDIFSRLQSHRPTLLYAPTWQDADRSTSFFDYFKTLLLQLPSDWNLIVKVHPLLEQRDPARYYANLAQIEKKSNAILVDAFPPVHPILNRVDAYLGDFSSIGYDFLFFKRPMFFFPHPTLPTGRLFSCGRILNPSLPIFQAIEKNLNHPFSSSQKKLYNQAFKKTDIVQLRDSISSCRREDKYRPQLI